VKTLGRVEVCMGEDRSTPKVAATANAREYFHELLAEAIKRQRTDVGHETEAYLVNLLTDFLSSDQLFIREADGHLGQEPLAFMLKRAIEAPRPQRAIHLRRMGDTALYVSGFFADSLERKLVDVDYYASMGGRAYDALSGMSRHQRSAAVVFSELAAKFLRIVDLFNEISERAAVTSNTGILRLYERYVRTGSERLRNLLEDRGVLAVSVPVTVQ
jgi:hypothetical protein